MSSISSINSTSYANYGNFASGKRIQSAADGAAELSIIQKDDAQVRGYQAGANNIATGKDLLNVADGAMSGIADYLQRIRELAVQASNTAIYSDSDLEDIQAEIDQMKQGISDIATRTTFNNKTLLDGSNTSLNIATDANGNGMKIDLANAVLQELGIADFDVTKDFDIQTIDNALDKVGAGRSSMGAQSNALEYAYNYNTNTMLNTTASQSRLEDLDYPKAISEKQKNDLLREYSLLMQKKQMENETNQMRNFFAFV